MQVPIQILFRQMEPSNEVEAKIRERCHKLERFVEHIICCRLTIDAPSRRQHKDELYQVNMDLTLSDGELTVRPPPHKDVYVAIRDAFEIARRQLEEYVRRRRAELKLHGTLSHGQTT